MRLPIHVKGKVLLKRKPNNELTTESLRDNLTDTILQEGAKSVEATNDDISFKVGWFRPFLGWKLLVPITIGQISILADGDKLLVKYRLSFEHLIIIATAMTALMSVPILSASLSLADRSFQLMSILFIWIWLVFGNVAITAFRFPRFIRRCAADVERQFYIKMNK